MDIPAAIQGYIEALNERRKKKFPGDWKIVFHLTRGSVVAPYADGKKRRVNKLPPKETSK